MKRKKRGRREEGRGRKEIKSREEGGGNRREREDKWRKQIKE